MLVKIKDFAQERKVDRDTIGKWIRRHPEVACQIIKYGRDNAIDTGSSGYQMLEEQYPIPEQGQPRIEDLQKEIIELQQEVIRLKSRGLIDRIRNR